MANELMTMCSVSLVLRKYMFIHVVCHLQPLDSYNQNNDSDKIQRRCKIFQFMKSKIIQITVLIFDVFSSSQSMIELCCSLAFREMRSDHTPIKKKKNTSERFFTTAKTWQEPKLWYIYTKYYHGSKKECIHDSCEILWIPKPLQ